MPGPAGRGFAIQARKALGQHFLADDSFLDQIATALELTLGTSVIEVGAGSGLLTDALQRTGANVAAVEIDESLCAYLHAHFAGNARVRPICANVLQHSPTALLAEAGLAPPYVVAGNIPYYITGPILRHFLEAPDRPERLILTVQREVAESIAARPGKMSLLSVSVQVYGTARMLLPVPRTAFRPAPNVDSAVVQIDVAPRPWLSEIGTDPFFEIVRAGFRTPRKQLHNALSQGLWIPPGGAFELLRSACIEPSRRAQTLTLDEWHAVASAYVRVRQEWRAASSSASDGNS